jgi:hypothetical protein
MIKFRLVSLAAVVCLSVLGLRCSAEVVYDDMVNPVTGSNGKPVFTGQSGEFGDELQLAGNARRVTDFYFFYFGNFTAQGDEKVRVKFYKNDLPLARDTNYIGPGTLLYTGAFQTITPGYGTVHLSGLNVLVPDDFTFTVEFQGITMTAGDEVGLLFYHPIAVGGSFDDFWQKNSEGNWELLAYPGLKNNFAAMVVAVADSATIKKITLADGQSRVTSASTPGKLYSLEFRDSFDAGSSWRRLPVDVSVRARGETVTLTDGTTSQAPKRFYRVVERTTSIALSATQVSVTSYTIAGRSYRLEATSDFVNWSTVAGPLAAAGNTVTFTLGKTPGNQFFRLVQL